MTDVKATTCTCTPPLHGSQIAALPTTSSHAFTTKLAQYTACALRLDQRLVNLFSQSPSEHWPLDGRPWPTNELSRQSKAGPVLNLDSCMQTRSVARQLPIHGLTLSLQSPAASLRSRASSGPMADDRTPGRGLEAPGVPTPLPINCIGDSSPPPRVIADSAALPLCICS